MAANDKKQCPSDGATLPSACSQGLQFTPQVATVMNKCANMFFKDPASLRKVPGC